LKVNHLAVSVTETEEDGGLKAFEAPCGGAHSLQGKGAQVIPGARLRRYVLLKREKLYQGGRVNQPNTGTIGHALALLFDGKKFVEKVFWIMQVGGGVFHVQSIFSPQSVDMTGHLK